MVARGAPNVDGFRSTAPLCENSNFPGDSGSPVLDDDGEIVGIVHRGPTSLGLLTPTGLNDYFIGSPSSRILSALTAKLPDIVTSTAANVTADAAVANDSIYLNGGVESVNVSGTPTKMLTLLGSACDRALRSATYTSPEDATTALLPCTHAMSWIECRTDAPPTTWPRYCPTDSDVWAGRFYELDAKLRFLDGQGSYAAVSSGIASLATSMADGQARAAASLSRVLAAAAPPMDFALSYWLARYGVPSYADVGVGNYLAAYSQQPHYERNARNIAFAASWLVPDTISNSDFTNMCAQLMGDTNVDLADKLDIESMQLKLGLVQ